MVEAAAAVQVAFVEEILWVHWNRAAAASVVAVLLVAMVSLVEVFRQVSVPLQAVLLASAPVFLAASLLVHSVM